MMRQRMFVDVFEEGLGTGRELIRRAMVLFARDRSLNPSTKAEVMRDVVKRVNEIDGSWSAASSVPDNAAGLFTGEGAPFGMVIDNAGRVWKTTDVRRGMEIVAGRTKILFNRGMGVGAVSNTERFSAHAIGFWSTQPWPAAAFVRACKDTAFFTANAALSGFELAAPPLSSAALDSLERCHADRGADMTPAEAVHAIAEALPEPSDPADPPAVWFTSVVLTPAGLVVAWAGNDEMFVFRGGERCFHAKGHRVELAQGISVLSKGIGLTYKPPSFETATFPVSHGDRVVIVSDATLRDCRTQVEALSASIANHRELSDRLCRLPASGRTRLFSLAVVAVV
jgi:hypothetical protein